MPLKVILNSVQTQETKDSKEQQRSQQSFQLSTGDSIGDTFYKIKEGIFIYYQQKMKNYHQNENISQTAAIRYQRQLRLCILLVAIDTILQLILSLKYKKRRRDGEGREMNPPDIVMYKTFIILSAGAKLSVMLFNVTTLFFH